MAVLKPRCSAKGLDLGRELGLVGLEWGKGSLEKRSGERVGAPGRVRMGEDEDEEGEDEEFLGEWRGEL